MIRLYPVAPKSGTSIDTFINSISCNEQITKHIKKTYHHYEIKKCKIIVKLDVITPCVHSLVPQPPICVFICHLCLLHLYEIITRAIIL